MSAYSTDYYRRYKRELQVAILENEDEEYLTTILQRMNLHAIKIYGLDDMIKNTKDNYILHYQGGRALPIMKSSAIGNKLMKEIKL